jgi:hypothetical protein
MCNVDCNKNDKFVTSQLTDPFVEQKDPLAWQEDAANVESLPGEPRSKSQAHSYWDLGF